MNGNRRWLGGLLIAALLLMSAVTALAQETLTITARGVTNVRSGPGTTYSIIGVLRPDQTATADGRSSTANDWYRIDYDDGEGWVAASVVSIDGDPTTLDVVEAADAESTSGETGVTATFYEETNIRLTPSTSARVIGQASEDAVYDINGRTAFDSTVACQGSTLIDAARGDAPSNVWLRINYSGINAWVNYSVVSVSGDLCDVEVVEGEADTDAINVLLESVTGEDAPTEDEVEAALSSALLITTDDVRLRATSFRDSEVLDVIPADTSLIAEARTEDNNRLRVTFNDQTGWIASSFVQITAGSLDNLPIDPD